MRFESSSKGRRVPMQAASMVALVGMLLGAPVPSFAQAGPSEALPSPSPALPGPPSPGGIGEQVAAALYNRGMALFELGDIASAKRLFSESLERSSDGSRSGDALGMLRKCNEKLGIKDLDAGRPALSAGSDAPIDPYSSGSSSDGNTPIDPYADVDGPVDPYAVDPRTTGDGLGGEGVGAVPDPKVVDGVAPHAHTELMVSGGLFGFILGMAAAGPYEVVDGETADLTGAAIPLGLAAAGGGVFLGHYLAKKYDRAGGKALSSGALWGMYNFAHLGNVFIGEDSDGNDIYKSMALGGLVGGGLGHLYASKFEPNEGEVAVANSGSLLGTSAALMLGVAMDPPRGDAYSLNATIGSMAGIGAAIYFRDSIVASPRRMTIVTLGGLGGGLLPWFLVYPLIDGEDGGDYRTAGFVSALTIGGGAYLAWRVTGNDEPDGAAEPGNDPRYQPAPALVQRRHGGEWSLASPMPRPMQNHKLAPPSGFSMGADVLSGRF